MDVDANSGGGEGQIFLAQWNHERKAMEAQRSATKGEHEMSRRVLAGLGILGLAVTLQAQAPATTALTHETGRDAARLRRTRRSSLGFAW